jgi:hypothetical protein
MSLNIPRRALPVLLIPLALAGCGKVQEAASEKAAEKMIRSHHQQGRQQRQGGHPRRRREGAGHRREGPSFNMEMGSASISEKDLGIPFYPGATVAPNQSSQAASMAATRCCRWS